MNKADKIQKILDKWKHEYGLDEYTIEFKGYRDLDRTKPKKFVYGRCYYHDYIPMCTIYLSTRYKDRGLGWMEKSVLWHEFSHAIAYLEDGKDDAHNGHWRDLRRGKPLYVLGDWVAKLTGPFMKKG